VCGIIEIKRNLNNKNIKKFLEKINEAVISYPELSKTIPVRHDAANPKNLSCGFAIEHPLIGLISLNSKLNDFDVVGIINKTNSIVDFIWSIDGYGILPFEKYSNSDRTPMINFLGRPRNDSLHNINSEEWKSYLNNSKYNNYIASYEIVSKAYSDPTKLLSKMIGWYMIIAYKLCDRAGNMIKLVNDYYLNDN